VKGRRTFVTRSVTTLLNGVMQPREFRERSAPAAREFREGSAMSRAPL